MKMQAEKRALDKIFKRRDRYEIPEWQRQKVWSTAKKQNLIDTLLRGWKLPKFYFLKASDNSETFEVVDGQQRLSAIFDFFSGNLNLPAESEKEFGGVRYNDLPDRVTDSLDDYEIEYVLIEDAKEEEIKLFFQRLQEGLQLTSSEKLNAAHSNLRDFLRKAAGHHFFTRIPASDRRYGHFDIMLKVAALEIEGIDSGLRFDDLLTLLQSQTGFSSKSNVAKRLTAALEFLDDGFSEKQIRLLRNRTMVQSLLTLACRLVQTGRVAGSETRVAEFFTTFISKLGSQVVLGQNATDPDFIEFQRTVNANIKSGPRIRQRILLRKLLAYDPSYIERFDAAAIAEASITAAISQAAVRIRQGIAALNSRYSAKHGEDLFKATNKTVAAQQFLSTVVKDFNGYEKFIDNLYFLFCESSGTRLDGKTPESFGDVKALRTNLRHDPDHGSPSKVNAKRKKGGKTFEKYSGTTSPQSLAPEGFAVVQLNLLTALDIDLGLVDP